MFNSEIIMNTAFELNNGLLVEKNPLIQAC